MAKYRITVNAKARPKGSPVEVYPFGNRDNGSSFEVELSEEDAAKHDRSPFLSVEEAGDKRTERGGDEE